MKVDELIREARGGAVPPLQAELALSRIEGWDSLTTVRLMVRLEQYLGRELDEVELASLVTVGDVQRLLTQK